MLDFDFDDLDLGARKKPTEWVATAPTLSSQKAKLRPKQKPPRAGRAAAAAEAKALSSSAEDQPTAVADCNGDKWAAASAQKSREWYGRSTHSRLGEKHLRINSGLYKDEKRSANVEWLPPEQEDGNTEYKLCLTTPHSVRFEHLVTQMQYRLTEGNGLAFYYVGVEDNGYPRGLEPPALEQSLRTVMRMADKLDAAATVDRVLEAPLGRVAVRLSVRRLATDEANYEDVRVVVLGGSGSGKSTLVSVLCHGANGRPKLDDGRGGARTAVFRHKHEVETGRTSAVSQHSVGYDDDNFVINYTGVAAATQAEVSTRASKLVSLIDVGGHKKYMKTALHGLTGMLPDYAMLCIPAAAADDPQFSPRTSSSGSCPLGRTACEHLVAAVGLDIPVFFVITKAELAQQSALARAVAQLRTLIEPGLRPWLVNTAEQAQKAADFAYRGSKTGKPVPVFAVSSVTGAGLPVLHAFLRSLQPNAATQQSLSRSDSDFFGSLEGILEEEAEPAIHFQVGHMFDVENVGSVASGTLLRGSISVGSHLWLGPTARGSFTRCQVTSIQRSQVPVRSITAGQTATVALHPAGVPMPSPTMAGRVPSSWQVPGPQGVPLSLGILSREDSLLASGPEGTSPGECSAASCSSLESFLQPKRSCPAGAPSGPMRPAMPIAGEGEAEAWQPCNGKTMKDGDDQPEIASLNSHPFAGSETSLSCWCQVGMTGGVGSPSLTAEARRGSKGAVLVDASAGEQAPQGVWEFEAEVVLLPGGHWPPRGLISGRWPPVESQRVAASSSSSDASCSTACPFLKAGGAAPGRSEGVATPAAPLDEGCTREQRRRRKVKQRRMSKYTHVIHSLATRQAATVIRVQELGDAVEAGRDMPPSVAAAEVMLRSQCAGGNGGCLARVRFQFVHHPDWLLRGARLLVRDRTTGHLAATGVVSNLCQGKKAS